MPVATSHRVADPASPALLAEPDAVAALGQDLTDAGYTVTRLRQIVGPVAIAALDREQALPAQDAARDSDEPAAVLLRLLTLGEEVTRRELDRALPRCGTEGARRLGLVNTGGSGRDDGVRSLVDLCPVNVGERELWLASDLGESATGQAVHPEHVLGLGGAGRTLAELTIRTPTTRVLDLGTGCGIQALQVAQFADEVLGTDISSRALSFAAFNAGLNEVAVDLRQGDMLAPVRGEQFDLVVSNPPFVITPRGSAQARPSGAAGGAGASERAVRDGAPLPTFTYRDGGRAGDDLLAELVAGIGAHLAAGGTAQLLANWEIPTGAHWADRVGDWLAGTDLDAWVIQREVTDPAQYAETWLRDGGLTPERDSGGWRRAYRAYLADFASRDVDRIGFGYLTLRRPAGERRLPWRRFEEFTAPLPAAPGAAIAATLAAVDRLGPDADPLEYAYAVSADVTEERHYRPGQPDPEAIVLHQGGGLGRSVRVSSHIAALVGASDGELTAGQIVHALAALSGEPVAGITAEVQPVLRELVLDGFVQIC